MSGLVLAALAGCGHPAAHHRRARLPDRRVRHPVRGEHPLNNRLGRGGEWAAFARPWALMNHLRAAASTADTALLAAGLG
ncbi:hypothetical protein [Pseudonocardia sp.]|jgi:hypothetical protein|uniref:hypothetical protein n=1 Tax=Pseudonocardia sp. TaxID=60912 RepID=UPI00261337C5|nr:hypothetical protein [Pseudonocardia sp.]